MIRLTVLFVLLLSSISAFANVCEQFVPYNQEGIHYLDINGTCFIDGKNVDASTDLNGNQYFLVNRKVKIFDKKFAVPMVAFRDSDFEDQFAYIVTHNLFVSLNPKKELAVSTLVIGGVALTGFLGYQLHRFIIAFEKIANSVEEASNSTQEMMPKVLLTVDQLLQEITKINQTVANLGIKMDEINYNACSMFFQLTGTMGDIGKMSGKMNSMMSGGPMGMFMGMMGMGGSSKKSKQNYQISEQMQLQWQQCRMYLEQRIAEDRAKQQEATTSPQKQTVPIVHPGAYYQQPGTYYQHMMLPPVFMIPASPYGYPQQRQ